MKTQEIYNIDEMLARLPMPRIQEAKDFIGYLLEKEKRHKAFAKRVLKAKSEPRKEFKSADSLMRSVREFEE